MRQETVTDVMTRKVASVARETRFKDLVRILAGNAVSGVPVVDSGGAVVGVVSESDLLLKETRMMAKHDQFWPGTGHRRRARRAAAGMVAVDLMSTPAITIRPSATVTEAARLMARRKIRRLPVVEDGRLVGIVSRGDLLRVFLRSDMDIRDEVVDEVFTRGLYVDPTTVTATVSEGVVTLRGQLERRSLVRFAGEMTEKVRGVVSVRNHLTYRTEDTYPDPTEDLAFPRTVTNEQWHNR